MADLDDFLGMILSGVSHARRISDEESANIAEHYKENPLLAGMSVPRLRIPELIIDIPVLIESHQEKQANELRPKELIVKDLLTSLNESAKQEKDFNPSKAFLNEYQKTMLVELEKLNKFSRAGKLISKETVGRVSERIFIQLVRKNKLKLSVESTRDVQRNLRHDARDAAFERQAGISKLNVNVITSEIKDKSTPANSARIKLTLREEGLEWGVIEHDDGSTSNLLSPE
ncbi:hypothetical protein [Aliikangiella maris]|uniref:Uncharacterized protein n=2 Tax=Aliikangiella maris TaxID=3162458 RepID=A0ABV2BWG0_9GAMM